MFKEFIFTVFFVWRHGSIVIQSLKPFSISRAKCPVVSLTMLWQGKCVIIQSVGGLYESMRTLYHPTDCGSMALSTSMVVQKAGENHWPPWRSIYRYRCKQLCLDCRLVSICSNHSRRLLIQDQWFTPNVRRMSFKTWAKERLFKDK